MASLSDLERNPRKSLLPHIHFPRQKTLSQSPFPVSAFTGGVQEGELRTRATEGLCHMPINHSGGREQWRPKACPGQLSGQSGQSSVRDLPHHRSSAPLVLPWKEAVFPRLTRRELRTSTHGCRMPRRGLCPHSKSGACRGPVWLSKVPQLGATGPPCHITWKA